MWDVESIILSPFSRRGYKFITILHPPLCSLCHLKGWWFNCTICRSFEVYVYTRHMLICRTLCLPREIENEFLTSSTLPNVYFTNKTHWIKSKNKSNRFLNVRVLPRLLALSWWNCLPYNVLHVLIYMHCWQQIEHTCSHNVFKIFLMNLFYCRFWFFSYVIVYLKK